RRPRPPGPGQRGRREGLALSPLQAYCSPDAPRLGLTFVACAYWGAHVRGILEGTDRVHISHSSYCARRDRKRGQFALLAQSFWAFHRSYWSGPFCILLGPAHLSG